MQLNQLNEEQIKAVYHAHMRETFPIQELRPLKNILRFTRKNQYACLGMFDQEKLVGYAFLVKHENSYLLDYLGVCKEYRNHGIGSTILMCLSEYYKDADSIMLEIEDPECADAEDAKTLQTRRWNFYLRNGYKTTDVKISLFGVDFKILVNNESNVYSKEDVTKLYKKYYQTTLPWFLYYTKVKVK